MRASEKMKSYGMERLAVATGRSLSIVYRWKKALDDGRGIRDVNKALLIAATEGGEHPITWSDFAPAAERQAA